MSGFSSILDELRPQCEAIIARYEDKRSALVQMMQLFQEREGFVSRQAMRFAAERLGTTPADVESTVSFYTLLYRKPVGKYVVQVCRGLACAICGAEETMRAFRDRLGVGSLETTPDGLISYEEVECLAACDRAPCAQVNLQYVYDLTTESIDRTIAEIRSGKHPAAPLAQTQPPERTWEVRQDGEIATGARAQGATRVSSPDDAGGIDSTGVVLLDRIVSRGLAFHGATRERLVREGKDVVQVLDDPAAGDGERR